MDEFFDEVQKDIVDAVELGMFDSKGKEKGDRIEATALLQRLSVLRGVRGISFAGFQMTTSNALTVASVVAFCMFNLTFTLYPAVPKR
eukprot:CAMPEP_0114496760 /NCGR_PEP_ID=MMETSP0109-20121206/5943_1 /TAXON_ID=29199 /ORGANISM="Chlorarachnion reptans, Strain CCCM449" /LENGTH=87 /DNA_ID=CAMNT_0001674057 /DNA_START=1012 /DNA_END=1275 /DNA_ORIENTATION=-